ncbi:MAG: 30S ribosomal protein S2 [Parcubacteria group bacterium GW2011_GWD2_38_12]|nr:MAG: 30S ribosomal protein S2 [Parcubacteria group bacterium GW2011_GWC2_36_17]KKQ40518.1 MAG: 30S ribosomal protein S2 [Candidatus Moranbacteria bacterium GW2011_GWF2_37_7]KKQ43455.1 MAG: 30S ribosomal protein S2 [Parcubacteria group bacterium GW2011_GWE2_37_8]KKQ52308.1 MAG: 30S ribosomal protein S2 [Parcubacteria group bacterium GW2011_GWD2_38_12]KKQ58593.1 MAG: 30S ribosomal protein S2 [Parcubacteria group bacterium GW2011_GWC1_38_17]KKQ58693.1 MAG: 30S ribosomal protein S2 [Parcubacter
MANDTQIKENISSDISPAIINEMIKRGVYIGKMKSKSHPKMKNFIFGTRHNLQIINLEKTIAKLNESLEYIKTIAKNKGTILFVATKMPAKLLIKEAAIKCDMPYVEERWLGGTLTNINTILKRIEYFLDLEKRKNSGDLTKYTKKEQLQFEKELAELFHNFNGIKNLKKLPDAIFVVDAAAHKWTINEAIKTKVPIIAIVNTDSDPTRVTYPIPANSESIESIKFILEKITEAVTQEKVAEAITQ